MLRLKTMTPRDFPFAVELANRMGWNMAVEDFAFNSGLEPNGCFVAFDDSIPVGICTCINYGRIGWFGNLAVKIECRRTGLGSALVKHSLDYLRATGTEIVGLYAYPNLVSFYKKFGFEADQDFVVLKGKAANFASDGSVQRLRTHDIERILAFDAKCFGSNRSKVLKSILEDKDNLCYFSTEKNLVVGYGMAKVYETMAELGPLVFKENSGLSPVALVETLLNRLKGLEVYIYLSGRQSHLLDFLLAAGFQKDFEVSRMFLGVADPQDCVCFAESLERG